MSLFAKKPVEKYVLKINGMSCSMCEAHINDAIRNNFKVKKVTSDRRKNETLILSNEKLDIQKIKDVIRETGYELTDIITN